jgi:hypothetical protein
VLSPIHDGVEGFGVKPHNESLDEFNTQYPAQKGELLCPTRDGVVGFGAISPITNVSEFNALEELGVRIE